MRDVLEKYQGKDRDQLIKELARLHDEIAQLKTSEKTHRHIKEALQKRTHALGERVKELNCLYAMSSLVQKRKISLENILRGIADIIPPAWQYPSVTCARIILGREVFATENFRESQWGQSAAIFVKGKKTGSLNVYYLEERPACDEGPFLKEERSLVNVIAKRIGEIVERKIAEDALRESMVRNKALLNAIPDTIFRVDNKGTILDFKKGKVFGKRFRSNTFIGKNVFELPQQYKAISKEIVQQGMEYVSQTLQTGETQTFEYLIVRKDIFYHYEVLITMSGEDEILGIIRDITERRRLEKQVLQISDWEQQRIGQDLHDSLCQQLAGVAFLGKVLQRKLTTKFFEEANDAGEMVSLIDDAITQTKGFARGLYPVRLEADGLMTALSELARNVEKMFGISCRFKCDHPVLIHDNMMAIHLYRIVQEAVNNAMKHGKATEIVIHLGSMNGTAFLAVRNSGLGFRRGTKGKKGMGLSIMKHRAGMIGASLDIRSDINGGTVVTCSFQNREKTQEGERK
ncbi:MAG: histidine kinase [Proteobacteria bacterium]|nr:histidine kinase [Pseudomonadota bacterium]